MGKKDQALSQLESALKELKAGEEERAATATLGHKSKVPNLFGTLFTFIFKVWGIKIILIALLVVCILSTGFWLFSESTFKKESTTFVEQVQELATLATAEAYVKVIIEQEDNKLFGKDIGVDFQVRNARHC